MTNTPLRSLSTRFTALAVCLLALWATSASGQITPSADSYTNTATPTANFGAKPLLDVQSDSQITYIQFDLSSIPAGYTSSNLAKASLKLYVNAVTTTGSFNVDYVNGSWAENTITANLAPALGTTIAPSVPLIKSQVHDYIVIDITPAVGAWLDGTQPNDGIALVGNSPLNASFDSKESTTQSHPPELDIVFSGGGGGSITGINTATGSGLTGGGNSGTLNLSLLTSCTSGQVLEWNGTAWACTSLSGGGTITGVIAGAGLTGGGSSGNVTLNVDATKVPQLNLANTFTGNQTVNGNLSATGVVTGSSYQIGSDLFAFGSHASGNAFLGFGGNPTATGAQNMASGAFALASNTTGTGNAAGGYASLFSNTTGTFSTAMGWESLGNNTSGGFNTAVGDVALVANTTGGENTAVGDSALSNNTTGITNTGIGESSMIFNQTGSYNTGLGYFAGTGSSHPDLVNATAIGSYAEVDVSNAVVLGSIAGVNKATVSAKVGIGTTNPSFTLDVHGNGNFTGPVTFAPGQTFPGTGTITGVTPGTDLTGGGSSGTITLNVDTTKVVTGVLAGTDLTGGGTGGVQTLSLDTTKVPLLANSNTFTGNQTVNGNLSATGTVTGSSYQIGSSLFAFGTFGNGNAFLGFAGNTTMTGTQNTGIGGNALLNNTLGLGNTAVGANALTLNTTGSQNTASGSGTLVHNTGSGNTGDGSSALFSNTGGSQNTATGANALATNETGNQNTASGAAALQSNQSGTNNTGVGFSAGTTRDSSRITANNNTFLGANATMLTGTLTNATAIGANAEVAESNALVLGSINGVNGATADTLVGIGIIAPAYKLHVGNFMNSFRAEGPATSGTGGLAASFGGFGDFGIDASGIPQGRFVVKESGSVGIGAPAPTHIFQVGQGKGAAFADSWSTYSSRRWKTNIRTLPDALAKVEHLRGVTYDLKGNGKHEIGVIAEEVGQVVPEVVSYEENGKDAQGVDYSRLTALLIEATKQQQKQFRQQQIELAKALRQIKQQQNQLRAQSSAMRSLEDEVHETRETLRKVNGQLAASQLAVVAAK